MTSVPRAQLTLDFEPSLAERWGTLREFVAHRVMVQAKPAKVIAADLDMSPSTLSRKLSPGEGDTSRFNVDDLDRYLAAKGDAPAIIEYIASKYLGGGDDARKARAIANVEALSAELAKALASLKGEP